MQGRIDGRHHKRHALTAAWSIAPSLAAAVLLAGCVSERPHSSTDATQEVNLSRFEPGLILITSRPGVAAINFDPPNDRLESASEGAGNAVRTVLNTPDLAHPQIEAAVGVVGFALSPFAAAYGAIHARHERLSPDKLSETEQDLALAMRSNAASVNLRDKVCEIARQKTRRLVACADSALSIRTNSAPVSAVLEVAVERFELKVAKDRLKAELQTEDRLKAGLQTTNRLKAEIQTGGHPNQHALFIEARARLIRGTDDSVLLEQSYHYQSGSALFIDWARHGGVESVAQTGYQSIAEQIAAAVFQPHFERPILIGPGQKRSRSAAGARNRGYASEIEFPLINDSLFQFVSMGQDDASSVEIRTRGGNPSLLLQGPGSESPGNPGAQSNTEWAMDGLENDRNSVVQAAACLAAVPLGLWEQTVGALLEGSREKKEKLATALNSAAGQDHFDQELADEVGRHLRAQAVDAVRREDEPLKLVLSELHPANDAGSIQRGPPLPSSIALEVEVLSTKLVGKHRNSRSRALVVEIQATIIRTLDGQELYSCPIQYRSSPRKLKDWAASDANLLHQELQACSQEAAQAVAGQLISRGLVKPKQPPNSVNPGAL